MINIPTEYEFEYNKSKYETETKYILRGFVIGCDDKSSYKISNGNDNKIIIQIITSPKQMNNLLSYLKDGMEFDTYLDLSEKINFDMMFRACL